MRLADLIAELKKHDPKAWIFIDRSPVQLTPDGVDSYRGYYEDLAIGVESARGSTKTLGDIVKMLEDAIGSTITGYKGGDYAVTERTRVWISNYGECSGSLVTGARKTEWGAVFLTWTNDDE